MLTKALLALVLAAATLTAFVTHPAAHGRANSPVIEARIAAQS